MMLSVTPLIPAGENLQDALQLYTEQLGFQITWRNGEMAGIARDGISFNLVVNNNKQWADNASFSIAVSDLDALYDEYRLLPMRTTPPATQPWGRREFHLILPSGVCFQFYGSK